MNSYTSADTLPAKLIQDIDTVKSIMLGKIPPVHVQHIPTNRCNLNCTFCSCADEDKELEMSWATILKLVPRLAKLGNKAVTITGGGEPLLHPQINQIIELYYSNAVRVGLVTNGVNLDTINARALARLTWCRISHSDERAFGEKYMESLREMMIEGNKVDWAFSYVVSPEPKVDQIVQLIKFANTYCTHIRLVADLFQPKAVDMQALKKALKKKGVDDSKVIYQARTEPEKGGACHIAYLKPVIGADGKLYRCCGVQYALETPSKKLPKELCFGDIETIEESLRDYSTQTQGNACVRCYYGSYNRTLTAIMERLNHASFI